MQKCGLDPQRWAEFAKACGLKDRHSPGIARDVSHYYFNKLIGGLALTYKQVEEKSGKKFSEEQIERLRMTSWIQANEKLILALMRDSKKARICKSICEIE
ncbi:MAG: hypothetical protein JRJ78_16920 [Deltaproteobacteria bacterium]|nr:hypothetical protein [Deltaproteobacteria bacterium]